MVQLRTTLPTARGTVVASLMGLAAVGVLFAVRPDADLGVARIFAGPDHIFIGDTAFGRTLRRLCESVPFLVLTAFVALYALRRFGGVPLWAPNTAGVIVLASSLALGPGLLVNMVLKDHSHRPRPIQVTEFGGTDPFRPWYRLDGGCDRNCSFVSGEGSSAFWTVAAALLCPPQIRVGAVVAAVLFGAATGTLRMAFGGHFLSDTLFAGLLTWLVIIACWKAASLLTGETPGSAVR